MREKGSVSARRLLQPHKSASFSGAQPAAAAGAARTVTTPSETACTRASSGGAGGATRRTELAQVPSLTSAANAADAPQLGGVALSAKEEAEMDLLVADAVRPTEGQLKLAGDLRMNPGGYAHYDIARMCEAMQRVKHARRYGLGRRL